jgi:hypothetical protein
VFDAGTTRVDSGRPPSRDGGLDGGRTDAGTDAGFDAGFDGGFDGGFDAGSPDAGPPPDAGDPRWPVDPELADCLGLTHASCAGCHLRDGVWYVRPVGVPPPPAGLPPPPWEECGIEPPR